MRWDPKEAREWLRMVPALIDAVARIIRWF